MLTGGNWIPFCLHIRDIDDLPILIVKAKKYKFLFYNWKYGTWIWIIRSRSNDHRCLKCMDAYRILTVRERVHLHYLVLVPKDSICMKIDCWIKPEAMPLFSPPFITRKHVCLQRIWPSFVAQKFKVNLIMFPSQVCKCLWSKLQLLTKRKRNVLIS